MEDWRCLRKPRRSRLRPNWRQNCKVRYPNESAEYRRARTALLAEEIELRRHIERVAEHAPCAAAGRRSEELSHSSAKQGPVDLAGMFGDKETLVIYCYMFGPQREKPCPMCTSLLERVGRRSARHHAERRAGGDRALVDRPADGLQVGARLAQPQALLRRQRRIQPRLSRRHAGRRRRCRPACVHAPRRHASATSGAARWTAAPPIRDRTRAARRT